MIFERTRIDGGAWFNRVTDEKYKTNRISVSFLSEFDDIKRPDYTIVPYILTECCEKYPERKYLAQRCAELYGAAIWNNLDLEGYRRCSSMSVCAPDDRYALDDEKPLHGICELLTDCIARPLMEDGAFDKEITRRMRRDMIDVIESTINDKRQYAAIRAARTAFRGEPLSELLHGTVEDAEQVTARSAWTAYKRLLERGHVEIFAAGSSDFREVREALSEMLSGIKRGDFVKPEICPSPLKAAPEYVRETVPMEQAILRMYFKAPDMDDRFANMIMGMILGGMSVSRFFESIREKQSLCYYCSGDTDRFMRTFTVYAGVEPENIERTRDAVMREMLLIQENGVTDEELDAAKLELLNYTAAASDDSSSIMAFYQSQMSDGEFLSPKEYAERVKAVTKERVLAAAGKYSLDTVYVLDRKDGGQE